MEHRTGPIPAEALARLAGGTAPEQDFAELDLWARPRLGRYFRAAGFGRADADDLVQQTLLRLLRGLPRLRDPLKLVPWLFAIARRVRTDAWARHRGERTREQGAPDVEALHAPGPEDLDGRLSARRVLVRLQEAIAALPAQQRLCLVLRVRDEQPYEEIAAILRLSLNTVRNHLALARKTLRAALSSRGPRLHASVTFVTNAGSRW